MRLSETMEAAVTGIVVRIIERYVIGVELGEVLRIDGATAHVVIDGDSSPTPCALFCAASVGSKVLVLVGGTQYYAIGAKHG